MQNTPSFLGETGFTNLGNTDGLSAVLQCLLNIPHLMQFFLVNDFKREINRTNVLGYRGDIATSIGKVLQSYWSGESTVIQPRDIKTVIGKYAPQFSGFGGIDFIELLAFLLDAIHEDCNRIMKKPFVELGDLSKLTDKKASTHVWNTHKLRNDSIITDHFSGQLKATHLCEGCQTETKSFDVINSLNLPIPSLTELNDLRTSESVLGIKEDTITIYDCLRKFQKPADSSLNDKMYCSKCKGFKNCTHQYQIWKLNDILFIRFKRLNLSTREINKCYIDFESRLDLSNFVLCENPEMYQYSLIGVLNYNENNHYTINLKNIVTQNWVQYNDSKTEVMSGFEQAQTKYAHVLIYQSTASEETFSIDKILPQNLLEKNEKK
ncbi:ubiquitin carboxyl-terminal hydrolase [Anaeramoeba flamelloides]|uniref:Ubiquitin carboxyl-terminal hydrolase n=1 Tax=Anaeramoeba flamelloides TaxID=1746091 RepID=A0AAV8A3Z9_9EUKA|nr:ubiquitin carboxyl-terminal hydrolase [Anaeramoeba flamelloides]